jgi:hypothetical protein
MTTRIKIKKGAGTPSGLTFGELAYDFTNKRLFIGITGGNALLANTDGGVATFNGLTGAVTGLTAVGGTYGSIQYKSAEGLCGSPYLILGYAPYSAYNNTILKFIGPTGEDGIAGNAQQGLEFSRVSNGLGLDDGGGAGINSTGYDPANSGIANLYIGAVDGSDYDLNSSIKFGFKHPSGNWVTYAQLDRKPTGDPLFTINNGCALYIDGNMQTSAASNAIFLGPAIFQGLFTGVTSSFTGLLSASKGISAAGGVTFSGNFSGATGSFSRLLTASAGISASGGATFSGTVSSDTGYRISSSAFNTQTGTTYTFIAADNGEIVTFNNGSTITVTVPTGLPVGFNCTAIQLGTGLVGFTAASGVTLNAYASGLKIAGQHGSAALISYASNVYNLSGTLTI